MTTSDRWGGRSRTCRHPSTSLSSDKGSNAKRTDQVKDNSGQITIRTSVVDAAWVEVAIVDNGVGIPNEIQQQVFDSFFTTKPVGKGSGMELSISYQIVTKKHGGKLECFSTPEQGTEFIIRIPFRQQVHQVI